MSKSLAPPELQHTRFSCPSLSLGVCLNSSPLSQCCHPIISSSVALFSSAFSLSQYQDLFQWFNSSHQVIPQISELQLQHVFTINIQCWFPLGLTGLISLLSKGLSRVFFSTTIQSINSWAISLLYGPTLIPVWLLENHIFDYMDRCVNRLKN